MSPVASDFHAQLNFTRGKARGRALLLATTALAGGMFSALQPRSAFGLCSTDLSVDTVLFACNQNTTTSNTRNENPNTYVSGTDARWQSFAFHLSGSVGGGVVVDGFGLRLEVRSPIEGDGTPSPHTLSMTNNGTVTLNQPGASTGSSSFGPGALELNGDGGSVNYSGNGTITNLNPSGPGTGLLATNTGSGTININAGGAITAATNGIVAQGQTGAVSITNAGPILAGQNGIAVLPGSPGFAAAGGIVAQSTGGAITVNNSGDISATTSGYSGLMLISPSGAMSVTNSGSVNAALFGIVTTSVLTDPTVGSSTISNSGVISAGDVGIRAVTLNSPTSITNSAAILTTNTNSVGIFAGDPSVSVSPRTGSISISSSGTIRSESAGSIAVSANSTDAPITIANSGAMLGALAGISTSNVNGSTTIALTDGQVAATTGSAIIANSTAGIITINNQGNLSSPGSATSPIISATSTIGAIGITNNAGGVIKSIANSPSDLAISTSGGPATVNNAGTLTGRLSLEGSSNAVSNAGMWSTSGASTVGGVFNNLAGGASLTSGTTSINGLSSLTNAGTLTTAGFTTFSGAFSVTNSGTFSANGATSFSGLSSALDAGFLNSGTFLANGTTNFGGGNFSNTGVVDLANGSAFNNIATFQNFGTVRTPSAGTTASIGVSATTFVNTSTGAINLQNGFAGDRLTIVGNYAGVPGSKLLLDFATQTGTADQLLITGNASGSTAVSVLNLTPLAPFTTSPNIVQVNGTVAPNAFTLGTLQNFGALDVVLVPGTGNVPGSFALSLGAVPSVSGLSGLVALQGAQTLAFQSNSAVLDQVWEVHELLRRGSPVGVPLGYADEDPRGAYAASLPKVVKAPPMAAPAAAPPPAARVATWGRVYGDVEQRDNNLASFTFAGLPFTRDLSYNQRGGGLLAGADVVVSNLTSAADALIIGPFGGYTTASVDFKNAAVKQNFSGGTVGAKATYVNGGFFADAIVKADFLSLDIDAVTLAQTSDVTNLSVLGNIGYKFDLNRGFYVEPTAGIEFVRTDFSDSPLLTANTIPLVDGHATRVRAGARFGTEWVTNNIRIEPSVLPLVYVVVDASGAETFTPGGPGAITFPSDEGKVFGEIQASVNFFDLGSGWSGFVRGDVRFGEDLIGGSGKAGIRYQW